MDELAGNPRGQRAGEPYPEALNQSFGVEPSWRLGGLPGWDYVDPPADLPGLQDGLLPGQSLLREGQQLHPGQDHRPVGQVGKRKAENEEEPPEKRSAWDKLKGWMSPSKKSSNLPAVIKPRRLELPVLKQHVKSKGKKDKCFWLSRQQRRSGAETFKTLR